VPSENTVQSNETVQSHETVQSNETVQSDETVQSHQTVLPNETGPSDDQVLPAALEASLRPAAEYARLAATPPRGWNSWNAFRCRGLTAERVSTAADVIAESGLGAAGYRHVVIDDCWQDHERDGGGHLVAHPERFAGGIGEVSAHVHDHGLSFGIYSSPGTRTCAMIYNDYPGRSLGSYGYEETDALDFADWGVDYSSTTGARPTSRRTSSRLRHSPACGSPLMPPVATS
jgi:alpha-galactosidase